MNAETKHSGPVDVIAILRKASRSVPNEDFVAFDDAISAVVALIEEGKKLLPRNLCLNNPRWPDSTEIPLTTTLGELRSFAAALANVGGAA